MRPDSVVFLPRFETLCREVIAPAVWPAQHPLAVGQWGCSERFAIESAQRASFEPVTLPYAWGPAWSTRWFRLSGTVPSGLRAQGPHQRLRLRVDTGTEATVWYGATPIRGVEENRDAVDLPDLASGQPVDVLVEAACNHPFGDQVFTWDSRERGERWRSSTPGLLSRAEVAVFDEMVWRLLTRMRFGSQLLSLLDPRSVRAQDLYACLRHAADAVDDADVPGSAERALAILNQGLARSAPGSAPRLICVAHAHIDTAWLWTIAETRRKTVRSWTNALDLMDQDPDLHFMCSQPQQYAWLETDAPSVFERIKAKAAEGRWEPVGSMWVEPDTLIPSGESLVRQMLYGVRYFESRFGANGRQTCVYLPDTFGFPPCLPTIMRSCGVSVFITNKLAWNQANTFPHTSFRWRGLDGCEVLAHNTPGGDYNATLTPKELVRAADHVRGRDQAGLMGPAVALQPFGFGDGGGGPTAEMVERARAGSDCDGLPRAELGSVHTLIDALHEEDEQAGGLPVWDGPLDLELHRGTLTTHAWLKRANAEGERLLRSAELIAFGRTNTEDAWQTQLDGAWERLLLNQFHDILPGSSIAPVYEDARRDQEFVARSAKRVRAAGAGAGQPMVLNTASDPASGVVETANGLRYVDAAAYALGEILSGRNPPSVEVDGRRVSNGLVSFELDDCGRLAHLSVGGGVNLASDRPLNELRLYRDRPMNWDAWDIDLDYERLLVWSNDRPTQVNLVRSDPLRVEWQVSGVAGGSAYRQTFRLDAGSPFVEVDTEIDWQENHRLLRTESTVPVRAERATVGTQFGYVTRPNHRNTSHDRFAFEFACHRWMDLSEPGQGLAVLADAIYGRSVHGGTMGLSLLRSPSHPDPAADRGVNRLRYAYMPHTGDWRSADVDRYAQSFCEPLHLLDAAGPVRPFSIDRGLDDRIEVAAFKRAADAATGRVLRLVETRGRHAEITVRFELPTRSIRIVDALERPISGHEPHEGAEVRLRVRPFELITLMATMG
ncbi:MAG: alpha-mannosidase [Planctomycetota bacterium]|nr:MAG: alpha-mannosidase [Planctomycetota bacterium]